MLRVQPTLLCPVCSRGGTLHDEATGPATAIARFVVRVGEHAQERCVGCATLVTVATRAAHAAGCAPMMPCIPCTTWLPSRPVWLEHMSAVGHMIVVAQPVAADRRISAAWHGDCVVRVTDGTTLHAPTDATELCVVHPDSKRADIVVVCVSEHPHGRRVEVRGVSAAPIQRVRLLTVACGGSVLELNSVVVGGSAQSTRSSPPESPVFDRVPGFDCVLPVAQPASSDVVVTVSLLLDD
jgi:hypothetical protein